jgi:hypothetical protein
MLRERIEGKWIDCFAEVFGRCGVTAGDAAAILSETQSRPVNVELAELALARLGARAFTSSSRARGSRRRRRCARPARATRSSALGPW